MFVFLIIINFCLFEQGSATGSLEPLDQFPVKFELDSEISEELIKARLSSENYLPFGTYKLTSSIGSYSVAGNGKINQDHINNDIDIKLPGDYPISSFQWKSANQYTPLQKV